MSATIARLRHDGYGSTLVGVLIVALFLFPVYWMVATSLKTPPAIFSSPPSLVPTPPTLEAYQEAVFGDPMVLRSMLNSVVVSLGTMALTVLLAAPAAYALARLALPGGPLVLLLLLVSQLLPSIVMAGPLFVIFSRLGLVNSFQALILADTTLALPFAVIILRPFFLSVPKDLEAAALVDGATRWGSFLRITLPLVRPGLVTVAAFAFLFAWGEFIFALSLNQDETLQPITVALNRLIGQYGTEWNSLMAISTAVAVPIIAVFAGLQKFIVGGLTTGATKE